jgi:sulfur carrier protein
MSEDTTIAVLLDDGPRRIAAGTTLAALVAELGHAPGAVGTAVNGRFVARGLREGLQLSSGDSILLFQAITGG